MEKELIYIGSVNKALKAKEVLKQKGIYSQIERSMDNGNEGCGYSVLIISGSRSVAEEILNMHGLINQNLD